jgi:hypothetical protein
MLKKNYIREEPQVRSARIIHRIISHFPIFHATLPIKPSTIRIIATMRNMSPRLSIQVVAIEGDSSSGDLYRVYPEILPDDSAFRSGRG